jgi:hypothetical protein
VGKCPQILVIQIRMVTLPRLLVFWLTFSWYHLGSDNRPKCFVPTWGQLIPALNEPENQLLHKLSFGNQFNNIKELYGI